MAEFFADSQAKPLDANTTAKVVWLVGKFIAGTVQIVADGRVPWTNAVVTLERSNNGIDFVALETSETMTADGITRTIDLTGTAFLAAEITTANGAALTLNLWGCFKT